MRIEETKSPSDARIEVRTQLELDRALKGDTTPVCSGDQKFRCYSFQDKLVEAEGDIEIEARGSIQLKLSGRAKAKCHGVRVEASEESSVRALGKSSVKASDQVKVEAGGEAIVIASGQAEVIARASSRVSLCDEATCEAQGRTQIRAYDQSSVRASGNAYVIARDQAKVEASDGVIVEGYDQAEVQSSSIRISILQGCRGELSGDGSAELKGRSRLKIHGGSFTARDLSYVEVLSEDVFGFAHDHARVLTPWPEKIKQCSKDAEILLRQRGLDEGPLLELLAESGAIEKR